MPEEENNSIRDVSRSAMRRGSPSRRNTPHTRKRAIGDPGDRDPVSVPRRRRRGMGRGISFWFVGILIFIVAVLGVGLMSTTFSMFTMEVELDTRTVSIEKEQLHASRKPLQTGDLLFDLLSPIKIDRSRTVAADGETSIDTKALGTLTVFNTNTDPLRLVNKTRFESEDNGFTYLLQGRQTVPGGTTRAGTFTPGQLVVTVKAREEGTNRNLNKKETRFTIPGLADTKYKNSYATLKTSLEGGFNGTRFYINKDKEKKIQEELREEIQEALLRQIREDVGKQKEYVFFETAILFEYENLEMIQGEGNLTLQKQGTAHVFIFREKDIARLLDIKNGPLYNVSPSLLYSGTGDLSLEIENKEKLDEDVTEFIFTLDGGSVVAWDIDGASFFENIKGKQVSGVENALKDQYPFILQIVKSDLFPFWIRTIPKIRSKFTFTKIYKGQSEPRVNAAENEI